VLERKVPARPSKGHHPMNDEVAVLHVAIIQRPNTNLGYLQHRYRVGHSAGHVDGFDKMNDFSMLKP
jgi:hypothetical protein